MPAGALFAARVRPDYRLATYLSRYPMLRALRSPRAHSVGRINLSVRVRDSPEHVLCLVVFSFLPLLFAQFLLSKSVAAHRSGPSSIEDLQSAFEFRRRV